MKDEEFSEEKIFRGGGSFRRGGFSKREDFRWGNFPGGNFPRGEYFGGEFIEGGVFLEPLIIDPCSSIIS